MQQISRLITAGADVDWASVNSGENALTVACRGGHVEVARALLDHGVDVHAATDGGDSALTLAEAAGNPELVDLVRRSGTAAPPPAAASAPLHSARVVSWRDTTSGVPSREAMRRSRVDESTSA